MTTQVLFEEMEKVDVLTPRVTQRIQEYRLAKKHYVSASRGRLLTESWKETDGEPIVVRKASALRKMAEAIPVYIRDGELIVGSQTQEIRGSHDYPEWDANMFLKEFQSDKFTVAEDFMELDLDRKEKQLILEDASYWKSKSVVDHIEKELEALWGSRPRELREARMWLVAHSNPPSGSCVDFQKVLNKGLNGVIAEIRSELDKPRDLSREGIHKFNELRAMIIACEAVIRYAQRHAELARELAQRETNMTKKGELEKIAEICQWVPANPARNFHEALQSFWFVHLSTVLESPGAAKSPGRFDQYMYPFYEKDIQGGRVTRQEAAELMACLWVKLNEIQNYKRADSREFYQGTELQNLTIGGVTEDGADASNELSFLVLEVERQTKLPQPQISLRYHDKISHELLVKAVQTTVAAAGKPAFFNDKAAILGLCESGIPLKEARDWAPIGCVEKYIPACSGPFRKYGINLAKCLELALNNGIDPRTGKQLGLATGDAANFASFEEVCEALKQQVAYIIQRAVDEMRVVQWIRGQLYPLPFHSALYNDCIEKGLDIMEGGMRYLQHFSGIDTLSPQNLADSLAAIKKLVFENKVISMSELLDALRVNFEGKEKLRAMLLAAPKYGNDDDYVDEILADIFRWTEPMVRNQVSVFGAPYCIARKSLTGYQFFGKVVGALPDGRKAKEPLADGTLSPMRGADVKGPTAVLNSAAKVDAIGSEATLINQKFFPRTVQTREGIEKFLSLIKTYFDRYGYHIQFNVFDPQTLLDAKAHPEQYKDLVVRVAGYSAYFVELSPEVQDEIIARTTQSL